MLYPAGEPRLSGRKPLGGCPAALGARPCRDDPPHRPADRDRHDATARHAEVRPLIRLTDQPIVIDDLLTAVANPAAGAIVLFIGTTRDHNQGRRVERLEYEAYAGMAGKEIEAIAAEAASRWPINAVAIMHRTGVVPIGMASVAIAVSAAHRAAAFEAARFTIDRLKETVPIWKKEFFEGGAIWIGDQCGREGGFVDPALAPGEPGTKG